MTNDEFARKYGPWALVTGASDGIGRALARLLAERGVNLVLNARGSDRLEALETELMARGIEIRCIAADLAGAEGVDVVLEAVRDLDVGLLVASAGFGTSGPFLDNPVEDELGMIDVNCRAVAALVHPLAAAMRARGRGGIVVMSSIVAFQGVARSANYAATKAWVQSFGEGLRTELAPEGIDVVISAPGPVASGFGARAGMVMVGADRPEAVARGTLAALPRGGTIRPSFQSRFLGLSLGILPRTLRSRIMKGIMAGMTKHRDGR